MTKAEEFPIYIFNTLGREKQKFEPQNPPYVGFYVCGPTVYGDPHLGHARSAVIFDVVLRYLRFMGYKVRYVRNITDVGHLEDEMAGAGEDKIAKKARLEKLEPMEIVQRYTLSYHDAMRKLNTIPPDIEPSASGHILEQIKLAQAIIERGLAYEINGSVYFDMEAYSKTHNYGELSGKVLEDLVSGSRDNLEGTDEKRNPLDFALWKKAKPEHIMQWDSPWGRGFPGWHIECTAMSTKYLGPTFDIHGGGMDLQFPHHECEIAQNVGAYGQSPVKYWMHHNMLTIDGQKMAKSKGNFITVEQLFSGDHPLLEQGYSPMTVRFFMLQSHYGSPLDFSNDALKAAEKGLARLMQALETAGRLEHTGAESVDEKLEASIRGHCDDCYRMMSDDFNTARTIASLFELATVVNSFYAGHLSLQAISAETFAYMKETLRLFTYDTLGLTSESDGAQMNLVDELMHLVIDLRKNAREQKDFAAADLIRDRLSGLKIKLKDEQKGVTTYLIES